MSEEVMRLAAEVTDRFSAPIRDMTRQLAALNKLAQQQNKEGVVGTKEHIKLFRELHQTTHRLSDEVKGGLTPAMAAFGLGSLSVASAIAAVTKSVIDFGANARNLSNLAKFSGFSADTVHGLEELSEGLGSTKGDMDNFIKSFSTNMDQWSRLNRGALAEFFATQASPQIRQFGLQLKNAGTQAERMDLIFGFLADSRWSDIQRKILTDALGLPEAFAHARAGAKELYEAINKEIKPLDPGWEARAQQYNKSIALLKASIGNLALHIGDDLSGSFAQMGDIVRKFIDENGPQIQKFFKDAGKWVESADWQQFGRDVRDVTHDVAVAARAIDSAAQSVGGWKNVIEALIAIKAATWFYGVASSVAALSSSLVALGRVVVPPWLLAIGAGVGAAHEVIKKREEEISKEQTGEVDREAIAKMPWWQRGAVWAQENLFGADVRQFPGTTKEPPFSERFGNWGEAAKKMNYLAPAQDAANLIKASFGGFTSEGPNPLRAAQSAIRFPTEETLGGAGSRSTGDAIETIAVGTRKGVYDGMWDFYNSYNAVGGAAGGGLGAAAGVRRASLEQGDRGAADATGRAAETAAGPPIGTESLAELGGPGGPKKYPGAGTPAASQIPNADKMYSALRKIGFDHEHAAMLLGEGSNESAMLRQTNAAEGASGLIHFRQGRLAGLRAIARGRGDMNPDANAEYLMKEITTGANLSPGQAAAAKEFMAAKTLPAMAQAMRRYISYATNTTGTRLQSAEQWSDYYRNKSGTPPHFAIDQIRKSVEGMKAATSGALTDLPAAPGHSPNLGSIDPRLREALSAARQQFEQLHPGYNVAATSGRRDTAGPHSSRSGAIDMQIFGPQGALSNRGGDPTGFYHQYARIAYGEMLARHPELAGKFAWGGAFPTGLGGAGPPDLMHFDLSGERGRWTENWMSRMGALPGLSYGGIQEAAQKAQESAALHGAALRQHFGHRGMRQTDLLEDARRAGMAGTMQHKVRGDARLQVDFNGLPRGTQTKISGDGMFTQLALNRGRIPYADTEA
jgi:hypothetical protein